MVRSSCSSSMHALAAARCGASRRVIERIDEHAPRETRERLVRASAHSVKRARRMLRNRDTRADVTLHSISSFLSVVRVVARLRTELASVPIDTRTNCIGLRAVAKQEWLAPTCPTNAAAPTAVLAARKRSNDGAKEHGTCERITREVAHRFSLLTPLSATARSGADREKPRGQHPSHPASA